MTKGGQRRDWPETWMFNMHELARVGAAIEVINSCTHDLTIKFANTGKIDEELLNWVQDHIKSSAIILNSMHKRVYLKRYYERKHSIRKS